MFYFIKLFVILYYNMLDYIVFWIYIYIYIQIYI